MRSRRASAFLLAGIALTVSALPGQVAPARAAEYTLESSAAYDVRPEDGEIGVSVGLTFTNTTPDPEGQFSVFSELKVAIHDAATEVAATDDEGELTVAVAVENEVNVATVELRAEIRFEETATVDLTYTLLDGDDPQLRVRPSVVIFPAWSFGTGGEVSVSIPAGYELRVDGDSLTADGDRLTSGPIANPGAWLALVTALRPQEYTELSAIVPLEGGTADLLVRAFADDTAWGERTVTLVGKALPLIEQELGLPYPGMGQLILTETVTTDATGFAEAAPAGNEILVAFDQPPFTALHQVAHWWLSSELIEDRWIGEGMASNVAGRVAAQLEVEPPYDPASEAQARTANAFPLATWSAGGSAEADAYGYAASWALMNELETIVGADSLRTVLARVAASIGPYESGDIDPELAVETIGAPAAPLGTRSFLDHLETVTGADLAQLFSDRVLTEEDIALLGPRAEARAAFDELLAAAESWGAPDPVRGALREWDFTDALSQMETARGWLRERDVLLAQMQAAGLAAPDRLLQAYRAYGGGAEAVDELGAERAVVTEYAATADAVNAGRSFLQRIGLIGGADPRNELNLASGRFADGDLRGAVEAITEAQRIVNSAETGGVVRLASLGLLLVLVVGLAVAMFRRRASYTRSP